MSSKLTETVLQIPLYELRNRIEDCYYFLSSEIADCCTGMTSVYGVRAIWVIPVVMDYTTTWVPVLHYTIAGDTIKPLPPKNALTWSLV